MINFNKKNTIRFTKPTNKIAINNKIIGAANYYSKNIGCAIKSIQI